MYIKTITVVSINACLDGWWVRLRWWLEGNTKFDHLHFKSNAGSYKNPVERTQQRGDVGELGKMEINFGICILNQIQGVNGMQGNTCQAGTKQAPELPWCHFVHKQKWTGIEKNALYVVKQKPL